MDSCLVFDNSCAVESLLAMNNFCNYHSVLTNCIEEALQEPIWGIPLSYGQLIDYISDVISYKEDYYKCFDDFEENLQNIGYFDCLANLSFIIQTACIQSI